MAIVFELPLFVVGLTRLGILTTRSCARTAASGYFVVFCIGVRCRASTRSRRSSRRSRSSSCTRARSGSAVLLDRRSGADEDRRRSRHERAVSADWVLPVDGPPLEDASSPGRTGGSSRSPGHGERHYDGGVIVPGIVNAHSHLEYAVYAGFGDGQLRRLARGRTSPQANARPRATGRDRAPRRRGLAGRRDHDDRRLQLLGRGRDRRERARPSRDRLPRGLRLPTRTGRSALRGARARVEETRARHGSASRPMLPTPARSSCTAGASRSASRSARIWPRAKARTSGSSMAPARSRSQPLLVAADRKRSVGTLAGARARDSSPPTASRSTTTEIALLAARDVPVAHCPRSNACLGCGIAPLTALRAAGVRVGLGTDSPASTPSFDPWDELRAAVLGARARERRPDALRAADASRLATLDSAHALGLGAELGSLTPGKRADITVVTTAGNPVRSRGGSRSRRRLRRLAGRRPRDDRRRQDPIPPRRDRVARGTQHRKRRPPANARVADAARRAGEAGTAEAAELGGPALLRAPAHPCEMDLRPASRSSSL